MPRLYRARCPISDAAGNGVAGGGAEGRGGGEAGEQRGVGEQDLRQASRGVCFGKETWMIASNGLPQAGRRAGAGWVCERRQSERLRATFAFTMREGIVGVQLRAGSTGMLVMRPIAARAAAV